MSRCEQYQEWISRMVDGDLSGAEERELREHVYERHRLRGDTQGI